MVFAVTAHASPATRFSFTPRSFLYQPAIFKSRPKDPFAPVSGNWCPCAFLEELLKVEHALRGLNPTELTMTSTDYSIQTSTYVSEDSWLTEKQAAELTGLSVHTLRAHRQHRKGLAYSKVGRAVRYKRSDIAAYMDAHRIDPEWHERRV